MSTRTDTAAGFAVDRRGFILSLGGAAAAASFAPVLTAGPAVAAPVLSSPAPAVFWGLPYVDFTGLAARWVEPARPAVPALRNFDPHAELLAG